MSIQSRPSFNSTIMFSSGHGGADTAPCSRQVRPSSVEMATPWTRGVCLSVYPVLQAGTVTAACVTGRTHSPVESVVGLFMRNAKGTSKPIRISGPNTGWAASGSSQTRATTEWVAVCRLPRLKKYQSLPRGSIQRQGS